MISYIHIVYFDSFLLPIYGSNTVLPGRMHVRRCGWIIHGWTTAHAAGCRRPACYPHIHILAYEDWACLFRGYTAASVYLSAVLYALLWRLTAQDRRLTIASNNGYICEVEGPNYLQTKWESPFLISCHTYTILN